MNFKLSGRGAQRWALIVAFTLGLITFNGFSQPTSVEPASRPSGRSLLTEKVKERILPNGLRVVVVERHNAPLFFSLIAFRVGSNQELPNRTGLAHFLEHMLFKGTKTIGTKDYGKEKKILKEMDLVAEQIRQRQVEMKEWRYEKFEEYTTQLKSQLSDEVREKGGQDEAYMWQQVLMVLPSDSSQLPEEWRKTPWIISDARRNYWDLYRQILVLRVKMAELEKAHRKLIDEGEPLDAIYDRHGAAMHNAFTTNDQTTYMVGLPSNCLELFMALEADRFQNPVFRQFYREREVVMEELRMRESEPDDKLYKILLTTAFDAHPYGRPVIGWLSDIRTTLREDLEDYFLQYYAPNNCQITLVGDVSAEEVFRLAEKYFGSWKPAKIAEEIVTSETFFGGEKRVEVELEAEPRVYIAYRVPVAPHPDGYPLDLLSHILSSGRTSRFYQNLFQGKQLTSQPISVWDAPGGRYPNILVIYALPKPPKTLQEVEEGIYEELEQLKRELVSEWELEKAKNRFRMSELTRLRSNQALAFTLSSYFVNRGDWRAYEEDLQRILAVTPADIQRVAQTYFTKANRVVVTCTRPATQ